MLFITNDKKDLDLKSVLHKQKSTKCKINFENQIKWL